MYLESEASLFLPLDGEWRFKLASAPEQTVDVPAAWETYSADKVTDGPGLYRRKFRVPDSWGGKHTRLEARAISFAASVRVNGSAAGAHRGMWSPFQIDVTTLVHPGENEIEIEVWKPGARFPIRETLSGFLPDVATGFGGIWQGIGLRAFSLAAFEDLRVTASPSSGIEVRGGIVSLGELVEPRLRVELLDAAGSSLASADGVIDPAGTTFSAHLPVEGAGLALWSPDTPDRVYSVSVSLLAGDEVSARATRRIGLRGIAIDEGLVCLNSEPLHVRGVLDWGWDPRRICPTPSRQEVLDQIAKARALGFNLIKLCLFVPDETTFDVADETGMLLWLEMPMWLPRVTPELRGLALREYADLFRRLHHHPSIAILSLGCELNSESDAEFLSSLSELARAWFPHALHCDNSGSAEAYGGAATSLSDFYDYHFYTDPHFFQPLVQHFDRPYRPAKPWIYGEFCDADTLRDFSRLDPPPWWLTEPVLLDRDDFVYTREHPRRLAEAGIVDGGAGLTRLARRQATAVRKFIVEQVRSKDATGGYVITGWADTPITTSGVVDDRGQLKFPPEQWRRFNSDRVLIVDRERRRGWIGGDRPAARDPFTWWQGERAEVHVALSNGAVALGRGRLDWVLRRADGEAVAHGTQEVDGVPGGQVRELCALYLPLPAARGGLPDEYTLEFSLHAPEASTPLAANAWSLWAVPRPRLPSPVGVFGGLRHRHNLTRIDRQARVMDAGGMGGARSEFACIASDLTDAVLDHVRTGGRVLLWQAARDDRFTRTLPFWREAIHVFESHPLWDQVPCGEFADMRFFSVATDLALDWRMLRAIFMDSVRWRPLWRRFDARAMTWADYLLEVGYGMGRMLVTTLRLEGGQGAQPSGFDTNPMGAWMMAKLLGILAEA